jgi:hypothetical protein
VDKIVEGAFGPILAFSSAVSYFNANWNHADRSSFQFEAKNLQKLYDSGLIAVCGQRSASHPYGEA